MSEQGGQHTRNEQQQQQTTPPALLTWGNSLDLLSEERKQQLAQQLWAWKPAMATDEKPGPFAKEKLSGLEVFWLGICAEARAGGDTAATEQTLRLAIRMGDLFRFTFPQLYLHGADLRKAQMKGAFLRKAQMAGADLSEAQLDGADLSEAQLAGANLYQAHLQGANLRDAELDKADLYQAQLDGAYLYGANLMQADLRKASMDKQTRLDWYTILTEVRLDGTTFDTTNLSEVNWQVVPLLQDELRAQRARYLADYKEEAKRGQRKPRTKRRNEYQAAARAYRRLVVALQANGMSEEAAGYAYRAQMMQRSAYRYGGWRTRGRWLFSGFLDLLAGYGYKPGRSLVAYLLVIFGFAATFFTLGKVVGPAFSPLGALVFSVTSFHGRGFFPGGIALDDPITVTAAAEAIIGLLIEISFIATFTQRFFGSK